jgi:regulatory factor X 1/2/3
MEKRLSKDKLFAMCKYEPVQKFIKRSDYAFYQSLVEVLIPDVLRPIPSSLTQAIRNFAKSLEAWLKNAMEDCPEEMYKTKVSSASHSLSRAYDLSSNTFGIKTEFRPD